MLVVIAPFLATVKEHCQNQGRKILSWLTVSEVLLSLLWWEESSKAKQPTKAAHIVAVRKQKQREI